MDATTLYAQTTIQQAQSAYADGLATRALSAQRSAKGQPNMQKVKAAAQQFEGFFVGQMMGYMMAGVHANSVFGGGQAEETWRSLLNQEYGKEIAKSGKLGISDMVVKAMLQAQEHKAGATATTATATNNGVTAASLPQATAVAASAAKAAQIDLHS